MDQPSFFCAEVRDGEDVLAYTAEPMVGFCAYELTVREQAVTRYSFQRTFSEVYDFKRGSFAMEEGYGGTPCDIVETQPKVFLCRMTLINQL